MISFFMALSKSGETLNRVAGSMLVMLGVIMTVTEMDWGIQHVGSAGRVFVGPGFLECSEALGLGESDANFTQMLDSSVGCQPGFGLECSSLGVGDSDACVLAAEDGSFHVGVHDGLEGGVLSGEM